MASGQVGKVLGERWKALNDKQRAPYEAKAAADKKRYEDEKKSYNVCFLVSLCKSVYPLTMLPRLPTTTTSPARC
jgi:hypothetical protein